MTAKNDEIGFSDPLNNMPLFRPVALRVSWECIYWLMPDRCLVSNPRHTVIINLKSPPADSHPIC